MSKLQSIHFLQNRVAYLRDEGAYQKLFYHFHPVLFRFCNGIIKNEQVADELVSDVMLKVWQMESRLAYVEDLDLYLFKAIKNASLTHLSRQKNRLENETAGDENFEDSNENPLQQIVTAETERVIEAAVASLPAQCQMVFRLIREEGFSHKKVSAILDVSQNTIETHMRIGLKRVKKSLEHYLSGQ